MALLASCSSDPGDRPTGGSAGDAPALDGGTCELADQLSWVEANMRDYYLFYDQVPTVRRSDYDSPQNLLEALRVPPDTFSYIGDAARTTALIEEGKRIGYGWRFGPNDGSGLALTLVEANSPLEDAGVRRGEVIRTINGREVSSFTTNAQFVAELGSGDQLITVSLGIEGLDGALREVEVKRGLYTVQGVQQVGTVQHDGLNIGYLHFLSFIEPARAELDAAFAELKRAGVDELVLDLRFNGGGRVNVANELASRIGGAGVQGRDFTRFRFNDKETSVPLTGLPLPFVSLVDSLDLARVYVLGGPGTCSASEMVINGLEPFVDVVQIGGSTCGKPFGFQGVERCGEVLFAVEIEFVNDAGVGGYVDGLPADCEVLPDGRSPLGTEAEPLFAAALQHIRSATCPVNVAAAGDAPTRSRRQAAGMPGAMPINPADPFASDLPSIR